MKKIIFTAAAIAFLASTANAASNCWHKTGNWTGGESYTACGPLNEGGGGATTKPPKCDHEDKS